MTEPVSFDKLKAFLESSPFHRFLGLELVAAVPAEQRIVIRMPYRPEINTSRTATARVVRLGKSIGTVDVEVHDDGGRLVAVGRGTYATREG
jgi:acyl-coenzyme A thioesterase PaaI-like protein